MTSNHKTRTIITKSINSLIKLWVIILFLFPFYWMVITSFKTYNESILSPRPSGQRNSPGKRTRRFWRKPTCSAT